MEIYHRETERLNELLHYECPQVVIKPFGQGLESDLKDLKNGVKETAKGELPISAKIEGVIDLQATVQSIFKDRYSQLMNHPPLHLCKYNTFRWLKGTIQITHPYITYEDGSHVKVAVEFEGETLNGKPHGLCFLNYDKADKVNKRFNFRGMGMMREGELHGGPACFVRGDGWR